MGLQFRKSIKILPGVKINISKSSVGVSAGVKGLHASVNSKGQVRGTASLPGTGVRYTKTKNIKDLIPGVSKDDKKKKSSKKAESEKKSSKKAAPIEQESSRPEIITPQMQKLREESGQALPQIEAVPAEQIPEMDMQPLSETEMPDAAVKTDEAAIAPAPAEAPKKPKKGELAKAILSMYAVSDQVIDWGAVKSGTIDENAYSNFNYLKNRAGKVLEGDIDTYLEIISDTNPFDEFIACGSEFTCSTENPMKMHVDFTVNKDKVFAEYSDDRDLVEDYVCGVAIKAARDIFALLPVWSVSLKAQDETELMYVSFTRDSFEELNFAKIDASDTVRKFGGRINI